MIIKMDKEVLSNYKVDYLSVSGKTFTTFNDLKFTATQNDIDIQIKKTAYGSQNNSFQYKLTNWNDQWHAFPNDGHLQFINVDDGEYVLQLKEKDNDSVQLLTFTVEPHWYESWIGGILFLLTGLIFLWFWNRNHLKKTTTSIS